MRRITVNGYDVLIDEYIEIVAVMDESFYSPGMGTWLNV